ncbi:MAG: phosphoenolpyruvate-utilizing protein [Actinobacteria bacterium]|nr:phosphoenolpyruvate-utilizing protein [Actinomycetota bacterium]
MTAHWVVDDVPSTRFPIYGRGNAGEIFPNVMTPLTGSLMGSAAREGQARALIEMGAVVPRDLGEPDRAVMSGVFGGYLHLNLSLSRLMGVRTPGMSIADIDVQMFGASDAPPYVCQRGDRSAAATLRLGRFLLRSIRGIDFSALDAERKAVVSWLRDLPDLTTASDEELVEIVDTTPRWFAAHMRSLLYASGIAGVLSALVERLGSRRARIDPGVIIRLTSGIGGIETTGPSLRLWELGRSVAADTVLSAHFDAGVIGLDGRLRANIDHVAVAAFVDRFDAFLDEFGSRGPDEYELASDTWGTDPSLALAAVERLRLTSPDADPVAAGVRLADERAAAAQDVRSSIPRPVRPVLDRLLRAAGNAAIGRERAKGTLVLALYGTRRALFELARRAQARGGPVERRDCWLVTREELPAFLADPPSFAELISERAARRDYLQARVPPFVFVAPISDPSTWPLRTASRALALADVGDELVGLGVSPGVRRGRARVLVDPSDPGALEPGEIMIAPITDPAWTPLFLAAEAVVIDVGAQQSHAAIVAREIGIPAVVSVTDATSRVRDGDLIEVDGDRGIVRVLARSGDERLRPSPR